MSKIPEGATHVWTPGSQPHYLRQVCGGGWCIWRESAWYWQGEHVSGPIEVLKTATWNGPEDGLPPVGLEVEVEHAGKWVKCEVIAHFQNENAPVAAFTFAPYDDQPKVKECAYYIRQAFRPIRTAEQLAAEERSKACDQMYGVILSLPENRSNNRSDICEALYDAGYRKVEQP